MHQTDQKQPQKEKKNKTQQDLKKIENENDPLKKLQQTEAASIIKQELKEKQTQEKYKQFNQY